MSLAFVGLALLLSSYLKGEKSYGLVEGSPLFREREREGGRRKTERECVCAHLVECLDGADYLA